MYGSSIPAEEIESLHEEFVTTVKKSEIIGSHLSMGKLKEFMVSNIPSYSKSLYFPVFFILHFVIPDLVAEIRICDA